jgi:integrase-like protein
MIRSVEPLITVEDYAKQWLDLIQVVVKPGTYRRYEQLLKRHIIPSLGALPVRHVHKGVIKDFLTHKLSREVKIQNPVFEAHEPKREATRSEFGSKSSCHSARYATSCNG